MRDNIVSLSDFKKEQKKTLTTNIRNVNVYDVITRHPSSDSTEYNHKFYQLVDLFMLEHYPDYVFRFNVWIDKVEKLSKNQK